MTASRVEASFDVDRSEVLGDAQKARIKGKLGARVTAVAQESRSQLRNRDLALQRLRDRIERALHVPKPRRATRPTKGSQKRRLEGKRRQAERKQGRRRPDQGD